MTNDPNTPRLLLPFGQEVNRLLRRLRGIAALMGLAAVLLMLVGAALILVRLAWPVPGGVSQVLIGGAVAFGAFAAGATVMEVVARRTAAAKSFERAIVIYQAGGIVAAGLNFAATLFTLHTIVAAGVSGGLWMAQALVLTLNATGLYLTLPRVRRLRRLHYRPPTHYVKI